MEKNKFQLVFLYILLAFCSEIFTYDLSITIDISEQRLYVEERDSILESFPISTSKFGEGSVENSYKTPLGLHQIKEKIGSEVPENTIFISRINTSRVANIVQLPIDSEEDLVTSRILWLDGLEIGANKGPGIDTFKRYIYIHGTQEEGLIGQKASHGCIRMFNSDVVYLYELVKKGTKVYIKA